MENPTIPRETNGARGYESPTLEGTPTVAAVPAQQWRRVHFISPILDTWRYLAAALAFVLFQFTSLLTSFLFDQENVMRAFMVFGGLVLVALLVALWCWARWYATTWAVTDEAVWFRTGVLIKLQKQARLDRVQAVDIVHPLIGRLLGLGRVNVEVAGGGQSNFSIGFLRSAELEATRAKILALAARTETRPSAPPVVSADGHDPSSSVASRASSDLYEAMTRDPSARDAHERPIYEVPVGRFIGSLITSGVFFFLFSFGLGLTGFTGFSVIQWGLVGLNSLWGVATVAAALSSLAWKRFTKEFGFRVAVSPNGIRISRGLLEVRSQTIPPQRVHSVKIEQGFVWRLFGWYRVVISQAGYGKKSDDYDSDEQYSASDVLLPVGTREQAELALWLVVPDLGVEDSRAFIEAALNGSRDGHGFVPVPRRARFLDPYAYKRRAVALTNTCVVVRDGWLTRTVTVAPVERLQSVSVEEGPLMRLFGLVKMRVDLVAGPATVEMKHIEASRADSLLTDLMALSQVRRETESSRTWMLRVMSALDRKEVETR